MSNEHSFLRLATIVTSSIQKAKEAKTNSVDWFRFLVVTVTIDVNKKSFGKMLNCLNDISRFI